MKSYSVLVAESHYLRIASNVFPENGSSKRTGLLTELLGPNGSHKNYDLRFVGHSLGGSICALTGLRVRSIDPK